MARRLEGSRLVWLLLGSLIPLLFLIDWVVGQGAEPTSLSLDAQVRIQADGQDPWVLAAPMEGRLHERGLTVAARAPLRTAIYPWLETPFEAEFALALSPELLASGVGHHREGFSANLRTWDLRRADDMGTPRIPCKGSIEIRELKLVGEEIERAEAELDLICTSAGADLRWRSGDERVWTLSGPVGLSHGTGRASPPSAPPAPGP